MKVLLLVKDFFIKRKIILIVGASVLTIVSASAYSYIDDPDFIPEPLRVSNENLINKIVGQNLAGLIDETRDENGATSIREIFNTRKEENWENHCERKEERDQEQERCLDEQDSNGKKIYRNEEFGYSVKYPEGWENSVNSENNVVTISENINSMNGITIYPYTGITVDLEQWFSEQNKDIDIKFSKVSQSDLRGAKVIEFKQEEGMQERHFVIQKNDKILDILINGVEETNVQEVINSIKL